MKKVKFIEKTRQVGCTSELALLAARAILAGKKVAFFNRRTDNTIRFKEKLQHFLIGLGIPNLNCQEVGNGVYTNGGRFMVFHKDSLLGNTVDLLVLDEVSFVENLEETLTALTPTLSKTGNIVMSSTIGEDRSGINDEPIFQRHLAAKSIVEKVFGPKNLKVVKMPKN